MCASGDADVDAGCGERAVETGGEARRGGVEPVVGGGVEQVERGEARGRGEGVPRQGSRLVHGSERGQLGHDVGAATEGTHGQPAADHLAERDEVGLHPGDLLRAPAGHAGSR